MARDLAKTAVRLARMLCEQETGLDPYTRVSCMLRLIQTPEGPVYQPQAEGQTDLWVHWLAKAKAQIRQAHASAH